MMPAMCSFNFAVGVAACAVVGDEEESGSTHQALLADEVTIFTSSDITTPNPSERIHGSEASYTDERIAFVFSEFILSASRLCRP